MNNIQVCCEYLKRATVLPIAGKYARRAIHALKAGDLALARTECVSGHFVAGHDGDNSFLPVVNWLDSTLAPLDRNAPVSDCVTDYTLADPVATPE